MARLILVLGVISLIAGFAVSAIYRRTAEKIAVQKKAAESNAVKTVLPPGSEIIERRGSGTLPAVFWEARRDGVPIAYAFLDSSRGYAADIRLMVGCDLDGTIIGLSILSQNETPGLGSRMLETLSSKLFWNGLFSKKDISRPWFCQMFEKISLTKDILIKKGVEWHAQSSEERKLLSNRNAVTAITGATISTRAVVAALRRSIPSYLQQLTAGGLSHP